MPLLDDAAVDPRIIVSTRSTEGNLTGVWRTLRPVIDAARCTGCAVCWKFCPEACIRLGEKVPAIDLDHCKGCGLCVAECPARCVSFAAEGLS